MTDDLGRRVFPVGLDQTDALKVWYGVDGPINFYWHCHWAGLFDLVLSDQKDCAQKLAELTPAATKWLPVAVDTAQYAGPPEKKIYDFGFVGVVNEGVRPKRSRILELLSRRYKVRTAGGRQDEWVTPSRAARLYRQSRLVLNENLFPGVTTRMFEAMASGAMLLTENGPGLTDLFTPGEDLALYGPDDILDQAALFLADPRRREKIAASAREKVLAGHDIKHRAARLLDLIARTRRNRNIAAGASYFRQMGKVLFLAATRWPDHDGAARLQRAEILLVRAAHLGLADAETMFFLGLAAKFKGNQSGALARLSKAVEAGSIRAGIALGFLELEADRSAKALERFRTAARTHGHDFPGFPRGGGLSADQHFILGLILDAEGFGLTPGFSRFGLDMAFWNALEHYRAAIIIEERHAPALARLGDVLARHGAFAEAHLFLSRAASLCPEARRLAEESDRAGRLGYALVQDQRKVA